VRNAINRKAAEEGREPPIRRGVHAYSYRHAYVTRWIRGGHDPMMLCHLLGTSLEMLKKHYDHLFEEHDSLRDSLNRFVAAAVKRPENPSP
jgi:integrase